MQVVIPAPSNMPTMSGCLRLLDRWLEDDSSFLAPPLSARFMTRCQETSRLDCPLLIDECSRSWKATGNARFDGSRSSSNGRCEGRRLRGRIGIYASCLLPVPACSLACGERLVQRSHHNIMLHKIHDCIRCHVGLLVISYVVRNKNWTTPLQTTNLQCNLVDQSLQRSILAEFRYHNLFQKSCPV